jgi:hypothetical protein
LTYLVLDSQASRGSQQHERLALGYRLSREERLELLQRLSNPGLVLFTDRLGRSSELLPSLYSPGKAISKVREIGVSDWDDSDRTFRSGI